MNNIPAVVRHRAAALAAAALVAGAAACGPGAQQVAPATTPSLAVQPGAAPAPARPAAPSAGGGTTRVREVEAVPVEVAAPARVVVPAIGVDAAVVAAGLLPDGQLDVPDPGRAAWYTEGPRPGEAGPAVIVAHVSTRQGPDVFANLHRLQPGDAIDVLRADGTTGRWQVRGTEQTPKDELPADRIWDDTARPVLRLITCGGTIRPDGHYADNVIVYADPVHMDTGPGQS